MKTEKLLKYDKNISQLERTTTCIWIAICELKVTK